MLSPGDRLGALEVLGPLGAGGMGEVYRARDTRLGRDVAVKVLRDSLHVDPARLARLEREARLLAALNHPGIAAIHGIEQSNGLPCLVLELVEGPTLAERLRRGPLPVREALELGRQVAAALEAAHEKGIIHRDLKPSNIKLTARGQVKVLDFGLGRALEPDIPPSDLSKESTETSPTSLGIVLGTAPYMSPEQARGQAVDRRSDVWSFGCVMYEMLSGRRAFPGATVSDAVAAVLDRGPDWTALPLATPPLVRSLLRRCLEKNRDHRLHEVADARIELEDALAEPASTAPPPGPNGRRLRIAAALLVVASVTATSLLIGLRLGRRSAPTTRTPERFSIDVEETGVTSGAQAAVPGQLALCPDGHCVVYRGAQNGIGWLYLRSFDQLASTILPGTESSHGPFFSPDGRWLGFFADGHLKKMSVDNLGVRTLCLAALGHGASWAKDGTIYFAATPDGPISAVSSDGGVPRPVTTLQDGEISHRWPLALPGADRLLYESIDTNGSRIVAQSLSTDERITVVERGEYPRYAASGHLLFAVGDTLRAAPFDPEAARVIGPDAQLLPTISGRWAAGRFDLALDGTLAHLQLMNHIDDGVLFRVDRSGRASPLTDLKRGFAWPRFSPDGQKLTVTIGDESGASQIWIYDLQRRSLTKLTFDPEVNRCAIWVPDGRRIAYQSIRSGSYSLLQQPVDDAGSAESLLTSRLELWPGSWSPDGRTLAFQEVHPLTNADIGILSLTEGRKRTPFVNSSFGEWDGLFSPDGRLIAYTSQESGRLEVYVRGYPGPGAKRQVSTDGGNSPVWAHTAKELFYLNGQKMMVVPIRNGAELTIGTPRLLFEGQYAIAGMLADFDVTPDDRAFVMIRSEQAKRWMRVNVALNWFEEIERCAPHPR